MKDCRLLGAWTEASDSDKAPVRKSQPPIIAMRTLPPDDVGETIEIARSFVVASCDKFAQPSVYPYKAAYAQRAGMLAERVIPSVP